MHHKSYFIQTMLFFAVSAAAIFAVFQLVQSAEQISPAVQEVWMPTEQETVPEAAATQQESSVPESEPEPELEPERYDFTQPAPEREAVGNEYFQDAAFIGDSRTDGFLIYSGIGCGENLTSNGLSIFQLNEKAVF